MVQSRLKRAIEFGIEPAPFVPIDRNVPHQSSAPRAAQGEPVAKKSKSQDVSRQIDNLDNRFRQLEGDRVTYFLPAERCTAETGGGTSYKSRALQRGQPALAEPATRKRHSWQLCSTGQRCKSTLRPTRERRKRWTRTVDRTQNNPALLHESVTVGKRGGNLLLLLSHTRSQQTCPIIQFTATVSSAAFGRHTRSMHDYFSPRASSDTGRCVGVRAAVPHYVREADEEARALNQPPS